MIFKKWFYKVFKKKNTINYWDTPTSTENIKERYFLLKDAYQSLHGYISQNDSIPDTQSIIGNYAVTGHNTWNVESKYNGGLEILKLENAYETKWDLGISNQYQSGVGFLSQNFLSISFQYTDQESQFKGEVIYQFIDQETAIGFWIEEGIFEVGFEEIKLKNRGFNNEK